MKIITKIFKDTYIVNEEEDGIVKPSEILDILLCGPIMFFIGLIIACIFCFCVYYFFTHIDYFLIDLPFKIIIGILDVL